MQCKQVRAACKIDPKCAKMLIQKPEKWRCMRQLSPDTLDGMPKRLHNLSLPVLGMSSAHCAAHVDAALRKLPGVASVAVDLKANQAMLSYDPTLVDLIEMGNAVTDAGYSIPIEEVTLQVSGMSCVSCLAHVEGALQELPGVIEASASLSQAAARVQYIPGLITHAEMEASVIDVGYDAQVQASEAGTSGQKDQPGEAEKTAGSGNLFAWVRKNLHKPGPNQE